VTGKRVYLCENLKGADKAAYKRAEKVMNRLLTKVEDQRSPHIVGDDGLRGRRVAAYKRGRGQHPRRVRELHQPVHQAPVLTSDNSPNKIIKLDHWVRVGRILTRAGLSPKRRRQRARCELG
jgi:hypothetical protein